MTVNNNDKVSDSSAIKSAKKTLTLGVKGKEALERKIKEGSQLNRQVSKGGSILEVVSNNNSTIQFKLDPLAKLNVKDRVVDSTKTANPEIASTKLPNKENLTDDERQSRLEALKKAREVTPTHDVSGQTATQNSKFVEFSVVESSVQKTDRATPKEKAASTFKEPVKKANDTIEEKTVKKKPLAKKKERNENERQWKDAFFEEDAELETVVEDTSDTDIDAVEEQELNNEAESSTPNYFYNTTPKRVGKTKKDRYGTKNKLQKEVVITGQESIKTLAAKVGEKLKDFLQVVENLGFATDDGIDTVLDIDAAELVILEMGHLATRHDQESEVMSLYRFDDQPQDLTPRPPVITIMGHVDHGKTTLLDYIRKTNVVSKESGGITQHIGAYQITTKNNQKITFIDTPGHEAFAEMRARGALVTDIIILVVAADDGLKQQSIEVINHAQSAGVPIIVAVNKIDKPAANSMKVKTELLQHNVVVEEMGGKVLCVEISALKGTGIDDLLENILLEAELLDLKANKKRNAIGTVIESKVIKGKGIVATIIVQNGTLRPGDLFVVGNSIGKVRLLHDDQGRALKSAEPGSPVEISGFNEEVKAGDELLVVNNEHDAKKIIDYKISNQQKQHNEVDDISLLLSTADNVKYLPVILKTDVYGSKEAILGALDKVGNDEVKVKIVHAGVGAINESDVLLAKTTGALICGFNVRANNQAKSLANSEKINVSYYAIIYDLIDSLKEVLSGMLQPKVTENILGYARIKEVFNVSKVGKIAGCEVTEGIVRKSAGVRLLRDNVVIYEGTLQQLKRYKDDSREVSVGQECGIMLQNFQDLAVGDSIECYEKLSEKRKL